MSDTHCRIRYFIELPLQNQMIEVKDYLEGVELIKSRFTSGRLVQRSEVTTINSKIVYPEMIEAWK